MGSTSTRRELAEELNAKQDRISNLPSCLISHILSFLPTKNAVATSVLSTKWKYLWTLTSSLEFDDGASRLQNPRADGSLLQTSFTKFIYRVLLYDRFPCLRKFRLQCRRDYGEYHVYAWVDFAVKHNIQELVLHLPEISSPMLPRSLFTCRTLVKLHLNTSSVMMAYTEVVLPCLKVLHLSSFTFPDDHSITNFFSGCPNLEDLRMDMCIGRCVKVVNISAPLLTTFEMLHHLPAKEDTSIFDYKIVLNTPCLSELSIKHHITAQRFELKAPLPHLKRAHIQFIHTDAPATYSDINCRALNDLLKGISRVEFLDLSTTEAIEAILLCKCRLPTFPNLKTLSSKFVGPSLLLKLLQSSPLLSTLYCGPFPKSVKWNPPEDVPKCLLFHLKFIKILSYRGGEELEAVEFLLKNGHVLEKLVVSILFTRVNLQISRKLLMMRRASTACQIELLSVIGS